MLAHYHRQGTDVQSCLRCRAGGVAEGTICYTGDITNPNRTKVRPLAVTKKDSCIWVFQPPHMIGSVCSTRAACALLQQWALQLMPSPCIAHQLAMVAWLRLCWVPCLLASCVLSKVAAASCL